MHGDILRVVKAIAEGKASRGSIDRCFPRCDVQESREALIKLTSEAAPRSLRGASSSAPPTVALCNPIRRFLPKILALLTHSVSFRAGTRRGHTGRHRNRAHDGTHGGRYGRHVVPTKPRLRPCGAASPGQAPLPPPVRRPYFAIFARNVTGHYRVSRFIAADTGRLSGRFRVAPAHEPARDPGAAAARGNAPKSVVPRDISGKNRERGSTVPCSHSRCLPRVDRPAARGRLSRATVRLRAGGLLRVRRRCSPVRLQCIPVRKATFWVNRAKKFELGARQESWRR